MIESNQVPAPETETQASTESSSGSQLLESRRERAALEKAVADVDASDENAQRTLQEAQQVIDEHRQQENDLQEPLAQKMAEYMRAAEQAARETMVIKVPIENEKGEMELLPVHLAVTRIGPERSANVGRHKYVINLAGAGGLTVSGGGERTRNQHAGGFDAKNGVVDESTKSIMTKEAVAAVDDEQNDKAVATVYVVEPFLLRSLPAQKSGLPSAELDVEVKMKALSGFMKEQELHQDQGAKPLYDAKEIEIIAGSAGCVEVPWLVQKLTSGEADDVPPQLRGVDESKISVTMFDLLGVQNIVDDEKIAELDQAEPEERVSLIRKISRKMAQNYRTGWGKGDISAHEQQLIDVAQEAGNQIGINASHWDEIVPSSLKETVHMGFAGHQTIGRYVGELFRGTPRRADEGLGKMAVRQEAWDSFPTNVELTIFIPNQEPLIIRKEDTEQINPKATPDQFTLAHLADTAHTVDGTDAFIMTGNELTKSIAGNFPPGTKLRVAAAGGPGHGTHGHSTGTELKAMMPFLEQVFEDEETGKESE